MPDINTAADTLRLFRSGAVSDNAAQTNANLALGGFRSQTEVAVVAFTRGTPIANVTVVRAARRNGLGAGTLAASTGDALTWAAPGESAGLPVAIANGETKLIESSNADKWIVVSRTSASALAGSETVTLAPVLNDTIGFDNVSQAERTAGRNEYRCVYVRNVGSAEAAAVKAYIALLGTQRVSATTQLGASGAGTLAISAGNFDDWPTSGFCHIRQSGGTTREIVYYASRTSTVLTVPTAGRGLLGTSAGAGANTDLLDAVPGIRLAPEAPSSQPSGSVQTVGNETTEPTGRTWNAQLTAATGIDLGTIPAGHMQALWIHRVVVAGATARPAVENYFHLSFEA
jgi:hypothetical protein